MKIIKSMTIDISEAELKQIIVEHLKNEGIETDVDKVKFNLGTKWIGNQRNGSYDPYIKSCTVKCEMK